MACTKSRTIVVSPVQQSTRWVTAACVMLFGFMVTPNAAFSDESTSVETEVTEVTVTLQEPTVSGGVAREVVQRVVRQRRRELQHCYEQGLHQGERLRGMVTMDWVIDDSGAVIAADVLATEIDDAELGDCLKGRIEQWQFPPPDEGLEGEVSYSFAFDFEEREVTPPQTDDDASSSSDVDVGDSSADEPPLQYGIASPQPPSDDQSSPEPGTLAALDGSVHHFGDETAAPLAAFDEASPTGGPGGDSPMDGEGTSVDIWGSQDNPEAVLELGEVRMEGALDVEEVVSIAEKKQAEILNCYQAGLRRGLDREGQVVMQWVIAPSGDVVHASVVETEILSSEVESCMARRIRRWGYSEPEEGGIVRVTMPFDFREKD